MNIFETDAYKNTSYGQVVKAIVVDNNATDTYNAGKLKIRVPDLHGPVNQEDLPSEMSKYWAPDDQLPWAEVMYAPGTIDPFPSSVFCIGEVVYVIFTNTSYRRPLVIGTSGRVLGVSDTTSSLPGSGSASMDSSDNEQKIWNYLYAKLGNKYAVAGIMGNLYAESHLCPYIVQGDIPVSNYSVDYTSKVNRGAISRESFASNGPGGGGYGLAQWTFPAFKRQLYDKWKSGGYSSIGSLDLALDFLWYALNTSEFSSLLKNLRKATSIRYASDEFLKKYERPANQGESMQELRASYGQSYYNKYARG